MLQVQVGDIPVQVGGIPSDYYIGCYARVASVNVQIAPWVTYYQLQKPPVVAGTPSNSPTATLHYVSGYGTDGTVSGLPTASGTLTVMEGQLAVVLACIYSDKNSLILVTFKKVGTGLLVRRFSLVNPSF